MNLRGVARIYFGELNHHERQQGSAVGAQPGVDRAGPAGLADRGCCPAASPEAYDGAYDDLVSRARAPEPDDEEIRAFKAELQQALADPSQLPGDELFHAVDYGDGSDEAFLRRLCHDLYGDQPGAGADPHRAMDTAYYEDLAGRLYGLLIGLEGRLDRQDARQLHHFIEVGEYDLALEEIAGALAQAKTPITDQERSDMLALTATMKLDDLVPRALGFCPHAG